MKRRGLILLMLLMVAVPARADDAALGRSGETVFPIGEASVIMAAESVQLRIGPERTDVDLTFTFANDGPAKQVLMGFPLKEQHEGRGAPELNQFSAHVDGADVPVKTEKASGGPYPGWMTWPVPFAAGQTRVVTNRYWGRNSYWSDGSAMAGYILKTGASWKGPIGRAEITATLTDLLPSDLIAVAPVDYRWNGEQLVWQWSAFEPDRDVAVRWTNRFEPEIEALRRSYLSGADTLPTVKELLVRGSEHPLVVYIAVREGLRKPADFLGSRSLSPVMRRWLQDQAGLTGAPPTVSLRWSDAPVPWLEVLLHDPDGDVLRWGARVWLQPDEALTPIAYGPPEDFPGLLPWEPYPQRVEVLPEIMGDAVWARAWVEDGRGHRADTGLVKLPVPAGLRMVPPPPPATDAPMAAPPPAEPAPTASPRRVNPIGWYLLGAFAVLAAGAVIIHRIRQ